MTQPKQICGKDVAYIRKQYFQKKLPELLQEIQENQEITGEETIELMKFLEELKTQNQNVLVKVSESFSEVIENEIKPPSVDVLIAGNDNKQWEEKAKQAILSVKNLMDTTHKWIKEKAKFPETYWLDCATLINTIMEVLDQDRVYKDQMYRARLTRIMDDCGTSRAEAEERAKLTQEYSEYKNSVLMRERLDEFINICKKRDARINNNSNY